MTYWKNKLTSNLLGNFNVGKLDKILSATPAINLIYKFFVQKTIDYDFPTHLFIEPTSACNFHCKMCPRTNGKSSDGQMDMELFKKIVDEAKKYGPRAFCLHLFGEPLLAPNFSAMIQYIKEANKNNTILLTTNGFLLNQTIATNLVKFGVDKIAISFTSPDRETYFKNVGVDALFKVEENIKQLISIKKQKKSHKPLIFVRMITNQETNQQAKEFLNKWRKKEVIAETREMHNYGGNIDNSYIKGHKRRYPCYHLWLSPAIHWNGDVSICCDDYARQALLGNVKKETLHEMWTGNKINHYRKLHLQGKYRQTPLCSKCDVWNIYSDLFFTWQKK
ncbi:MAG: radical SAM/SPASM domain-containing protein [Candidatus Buchananbacteria bacterium]